MSVSLLLLVLLTISCVSAEQSDDSDNPTLIGLDNNEALNANANDFSSLADEIGNAVQTKSLNLTKDYKYDSQKDEKYSNGITINIDNLVIDGKGHSIDANKQSRIFNIQSKNVVLKNIIILNGNATSHGGAIYWSGANGTVVDTTIKNCISPNSGGGIYFKNSGSAINSKFEDNSAYFGGGISFETTSTVKNCSFENNFATFLGGGIYTSESGDILNSIFKNNEAGDGGGIYLHYNGLIDNCTFKKNNAIGYGGAITGENEVNIENSKFIQNTGKYAGSIYFKGNGHVNSSNFTQNSAELSGAIYAVGDEIEIANSEFNHNSAATGSSLYLTSKYSRIENITFNNFPSTYEIEVYATQTPKLTNVSFNNVTKADLTEENTTDENKTNSDNKSSADNDKDNTVVPKPIIQKKTKITAKSKTFKLKKAKKYTITLKSGKNVLKNKKIILKIKGKVYTKKTNSKGKCTFKLKLNKKGKFKAKIRFKGDKYYKASKKSVKIKIK